MGKTLNLKTKFRFVFTIALAIIVLPASGQFYGAKYEVIDIVGTPIFAKRSEMLGKLQRFNALLSQNRSQHVL